MNTKLVSSIDAVTRSRLVTIDGDALLVDAAKLLSDRHISLVVVCNSDGAMVGVITKTNIVQQIARCGESACTTAAAEVMTRDVDLLPPDRLSARCLVDDGEARLRAHPRRRRAFQTIGSRQCARCAAGADGGRNSMKRRFCGITSWVSATDEDLPMTDADRRPIVLITGATGNLGRSLGEALGRDYRIVGLDRNAEGADFPVFEADFTSDAAVELALRKFRDAFGSRIASVIHLVAYFDFTGEDNPLYQSVNVEGTRRLLRALQDFEVEPIRLCEHHARARALPPWRAHRRAPADRTALGLSEIESRR